MLRNVTVSGMKLKPTASGELLASGKIRARAVLPKGVRVGLEVRRVWPDVLLFDGEAPELRAKGKGKGKDDSPSLPDPLPERAFGHIRPDDWLDSESEPADDDQDGEEEEEGSAYNVSAMLVDVPLEVLPGRQKEFRDFVRKVRVRFDIILF